MRKLLALFVVFLLMFLTLAGCTPQDDVIVPDEAPAETAPAEQVMEETPVEEEVTETVKFGFICPLSGDVATLGVPMKQSVEMAVEEINVAGGIDGKTLEVVYEDGRCNAKEATSAAQKLINMDGVDFIIGGCCSPEVLGPAPMAENAHVIMMSPSATNPGIKDAGDYIFRVVPSDNGQAKEAARLMTEAGIKKVAILYTNNDWGVGLNTALVSSFEGDFGGEVVASESFEFEGSDMRTQLSKIKAVEPEALYMVAFAKHAGIIIKQSTELGLDVPIYAADGAKDDTLLEAAGDMTNDLFITLPGIPKSPELDAFAVKYKEKYGAEFGAYTPEIYDITYIGAKACKNTDCTAEAMKDYLYTMGEFKGTSGVFGFNSFGEVEKPYDVFTVKDGKFVNAALE